MLNTIKMSNNWEYVIIHDFYIIIFYVDNDKYGYYIIPYTI